MVEVFIVWTVLGTDIRKCSALTQIREAARLVELYIKDRKQDAKPRYNFPDLAYPRTDVYAACNQHAPMTEF
jgi:hypothetical protein